MVVRTWVAFSIGHSFLTLTLPYIWNKMKLCCCHGNLADGGEEGGFSVQWRLFRTPSLYLLDASRTPSGCDTRCLQKLPNILWRKSSPLLKIAIPWVISLTTNGYTIPSHLSNASWIVMSPSLGDKNRLS